MHPFNDEKIYQELRVPMTAMSHDPNHLAKLNVPDGYKYLVSVTPESSRLFLENDKLIVMRNISPHGLGGILLWDFTAKHYFELSPERKEIFWQKANIIRQYLLSEYGHDYDIITAMCISNVLGAGAVQSIDYTHMHFTLIPRTIGMCHGVKMEKIEPAQEIQFPHVRPKYDLSFGTSQKYPSRVGFLFEASSVLSDCDMNPLQIFETSNADSLDDILVAPNITTGKPCGIILNTLNNTHFGVSIGGTFEWLYGYHRERVLDVETSDRTDFESFNSGAFQNVRKLF